jgi:hypothetical protein
LEGAGTNEVSFLSIRAGRKLCRAVSTMSVKPQIYVETTVVSYLTARPSRNTLAMLRQQLTNIWWEECLPDYSPVISKMVLDEIMDGDAEAAGRRLAVVQGFPVLGDSPEISALAKELVAQGAIPTKAKEDATHLAFCAINRIPYLVTWNFKHIANETMRSRLKSICEQAGYPFPEMKQPVI